MDAGALDRRTGAIAWQFRSPDAWTASLSQAEVYGSTVYVYGGDSYIHALDANSNQVMWKAPIEGMMKGDLLVTERCVYATNGPILFSYDWLSGHLLAKQPIQHTSDGIYGTPAVSSDGREILVATTAGAVCFREP